MHAITSSAVSLRLKSRRVEQEPSSRSCEFLLIILPFILLSLLDHLPSWVSKFIQLAYQFFLPSTHMVIFRQA